MKIKNIIALLMVFILTLSTVGCGSSKNSNKLVIWTLSEDLKSFAEKYKEKNPDIEIETVVIAPADYSTKLTSALRGKSKTPDIVVGEPQMLQNFFEAGFFEDLTQEPYNVEQYKDKLVDYIYEAGKDENGVVRALSYQITPGGIYYRRDLAKEMWGNDDPAFISEKFKDFDTIIQTAKEIRDKGYRIFSDSGNLRWYTSGGGAWVQDGKLVLSDARLDYFRAAVKLYQEKLVAFAPEWSSAWYASMQGEIPLNAEWQELSEIDSNSETTQVFAYSLPSWGALTIRDNAKDNASNFGVAKGPSSYFGGGTFLGINTYSENKELAWDFLKFVTLDEETSKWWTEVSKGDIVSMKSVLESVKDLENPDYGNQKTYAFFYEEAKNIDYSNITKYDAQIDTFFGQAIEVVQKGEKTEEEALNEFYSNVKSVYPNLKMPNE